MKGDTRQYDASGVKQLMASKVGPYAPEKMRGMENMANMERPALTSSKKIPRHVHLAYFRLLELRQRQVQIWQFLFFGF